VRPCAACSVFGAGGQGDGVEALVVAALFRIVLSMFASPGSRHG